VENEELVIPGMPSHIHAARITGYDVVAREHEAFVCIWADGIDNTCGRCHEEIFDTIEEPPVYFDSGMIFDRTYRHGCGEERFYPSVVLDDEDASIERILGEAHGLANERNSEIRHTAEKIRADLTDELRAALVLHANGTPFDELVDGDATSEGTYVDDDGQLCIWAWGPAAYGPDDCIIVRAEDVPYAI
jgi:hypothetical protein